VADLSSLGRLLILAGLVLAGLGLAFVFVGRLPLLGRLPGDIVVQGDNWTIYVPVATMLLLSLLLTLLLNLFGRR
jgi:hypothetical protein